MNTIPPLARYFLQNPGVSAAKAARACGELISRARAMRSAVLFGQFDAFRQPARPVYFGTASPTVFIRQN